MKILFLDIASRDGLVACVTPENVVSVRRADTKVSDADLPKLLEETWKEAGWTAKDLTHVACGIGPGGFMSLRVGVSSANALAWGLSLPIAGIHLSDLYAARTSEDALWVHSTKKEEVFVRGFGVYAKEFPEAMHITLSDLDGRLSGPFQFMGELLPEHDAWLRDRDGHSVALHSLEEILPGFLAGQTYDRNTLRPWYGREG